MSHSWLLKKPLKQAHQEHEILGPFATEQLAALVDQGTLSGDDELHPDGLYWIAASDRETLSPFLTLTDAQWRRLETGISPADADMETTVPDGVGATLAAPVESSPKLRPAAQQSSAAGNTVNPSLVLAALCAVAIIAFWFIFRSMRS